MMRIKPFKALCICVALLLSFTCCGAKEPISAVDTNRMAELGNNFVEELNELIPLQDLEDKLLSKQTVTVINDKTYNLGLLDDFYEEYKVGGNTELTIVFKSKSFVVNKIVFESNSGYYYRYEYDPFDEKSIVVESQALDKMTIEKDTALKKVVVTLKKQKYSDIVITFRNIADE